jgi:hypothetical protein
LSTPMPIGETMPRPVMTGCRRMLKTFC